MLGPGDSTRPARIVQPVLAERDGRMSFVSDRVKGRRGEQIRCQIRNNGEPAVATLEENLKHAAEMPKRMHPDRCWRLLPK